MCTHQENDNIPTSSVNRTNAEPRNVPQGKNATSNDEPHDWQELVLFWRERGDFDGKPREPISIFMPSTWGRSIFQIYEDALNNVKQQEKKDNEQE